MGTAPLAGVNVVDVSVGIAGQLCAKIIADAGARVRRLEPVQGDPSRALANWYGFLNADKEVAPFSERAAHELLESASLLVTSARHGVAAPEIACDEALARYPQLMSVCVTPFGQSGPYADWRADDLVLCALSGLADATPGVPDKCARDGDPPVQSNAPLAEMAGGLTAAVAVLGALARPDPRPRHIEVSVLESVTGMMVYEWGYPAYGAPVHGRRPVDAMFEPNCYLACADGDIVLAAVAQPLWERLVELLGRPPWAAAPRFADPRSRARHWAELHERLGEWARDWNGDDLVEATQALGIPSFRAFELSEVVTGDQVQETQSVQKKGGEFFPCDPIVVNGERRQPQTAADTKDVPPAPLAGVRVLDLGQFVAGPFAGQLLAALGCDVVLVESSRRPLSRSFGPFVGDVHHDKSAMFNLVNRGKRSVTIDLTTAEGRRALEALVRTADVVVENYSRRAAESLGVTYRHLRSLRENIILASISGFGRGGPWGGYVAFHSAALLGSGLASLTKDETGRPRLPGAAIPDTLAGTYLALAVQQALLARARSGEGCHVEVSLLDVLLTCAGGFVPAATRGESFGAHSGRFLPTSEPGRFLAVDDPSVDAREVAARTRDESMHALQDAGIAAGAVLDAAEVIANPHLRARGFVMLDDHPAARTCPVAGVPWLYDGKRPGLRHAPLLGDATDEILAEAGGVDVESLRLEGVLV